QQGHARLSGEDVGGVAGVVEVVERLDEARDAGLGVDGLGGGEDLVPVGGRFVGVEPGLLEQVGVVDEGGDAAVEGDGVGLAVDDAGVPQAGPVLGGGGP